MLATEITEKLRYFSNKIKLVPNPRSSAGKKRSNHNLFSATKKTTQKGLRARVIKNIGWFLYIENLSDIFLPRLFTVF